MSRIRTGAVILAASLLVAAVWASTAAAGAAPPVTVKGTQTVVNESKGKYTVQGDLLGTWNITAFTTHYQGSEGQFVGSGKELFAGCRDVDRSGACDTGEPKGTIRFTFIYWATLDPKTQALVKGQCVHPVLGGTGAFAGVKGIIHMTDSPTPSGVRTTLHGHVAVRRLHGSVDELSRHTGSRRPRRREDVRRLSARRATPGVWEPLPAGLPHGVAAAHRGRPGAASPRRAPSPMRGR